MTKLRLIQAACATLLWAGTALATPTPQQQCDHARIKAWKTYASCMDGVVAKLAKGLRFNAFKAYWKCRHAYFKQWTTFQTKATLLGSTCTAGVNSRFTVTDSGATVTDGLTGLVWELKTNDSSVHDGTNTYSWTSGPPWQFGDPLHPFLETGTVFTDFLSTLNTGAGFAGSNGWRLPTRGELETIVADYPCKGPYCEQAAVPCPLPCIAFNDSNTQLYPYYWTGTKSVTYLNTAWCVNFSEGNTFDTIMNNNLHVRAVRGGL